MTQLGGDPPPDYDRFHRGIINAVLITVVVFVIGFTVWNWLWPNH